MFNERMNAKTTVEILAGSDPVIYVNIDAIGKMKEYVDGCSDEIGWLGEVVKDEEGNFIIKDTHLFKQQVHSTTCEITTEGLTEFANEILAQPGGIDKWNDIKLWGHSHVNMGVSPSGQDNMQMNIFKDCGHDFFIRVIANKKGDMEFTIYDYYNGLTYKNARWCIFYNNREIYDVQKQIDALQATLRGLKQPSIDKVGIKTEMTNKVSKIVTRAYGGYGNVYGNVYGGNVISAQGKTQYADWYDEQYCGEDITTLNKGKKKSQQTSQVQINMETNEISGGGNCTVEDEINQMYLDNDIVGLETLFSISAILEYANMNTLSIAVDMYDEFMEEFKQDTCQKLKELCSEYSKIYKEQYGM